MLHKIVAAVVAFMIAALVLVSSTTVVSDFRGVLTSAQSDVVPVAARTTQAHGTGL